jgi:hypothetical protein
VFGRKCSQVVPKFLTATTPDRCAFAGPRADRALNEPGLEMNLLGPRDVFIENSHRLN